MNTLSHSELVGFIAVKVGSKQVQVPVRSIEQSEAGTASIRPLASFETDGSDYAIIIRGDAASKEVEYAVRMAATEAHKHLSRKLLN